MNRHVLGVMGKHPIAEQRFERYAITEWLRRHGTHPTSRAQYTVDQLERDDELRNEINDLYSKKEASSTNPSRK